MEAGISLLLFQTMLYQVCVAWREMHKTPPGAWHLEDTLPRFLQVMSHTRLRRRKLYHLAISLQ